MKLHHLGYAVSDIIKSQKAFESLGYSPKSLAFSDFSRNAKILFMSNPSQDNFPLIELISVLDHNKSSPVDAMLIKYKSQLYHPCFEISDINATLLELKSKGWLLIDELKPAPAIGDNSVVAFLFNRYVGIIELLSQLIRQN